MPLPHFAIGVIVGDVDIDLKELAVSARDAVLKHIFRLRFFLASVSNSASGVIQKLRHILRGMGSYRCDAV